MPMGPAARLTDGGMHGGIIVGPGAPMVLIGNLPAARVTDNHVCPMMDGPKPHVGGPIAFGSLGVITMNLPQARLLDPMICVGPPDAIRPPCCVTVIVGDIMPGAPVTPPIVVLVPKPGSIAGMGGGSAAGKGGTDGTPAGRTMSQAKAAAAPFVKKCPLEHAPAPTPDSAAPPAPAAAPAAAPAPAAPAATPAAAPAATPAAPLGAAGTPAGDTMSAAKQAGVLFVKKCPLEH